MRKKLRNRKLETTSVPQCPPNWKPKCAPLFSHHRQLWSTAKTEEICVYGKEQEMSIKSTVYSFFSSTSYTTCVRKHVYPRNHEQQVQFQFLKLFWNPYNIFKPSFLSLFMIRCIFKNANKLIQFLAYRRALKVHLKVYDGTQLVHM